MFAFPPPPEVISGTKKVLFYGQDLIFDVNVMNGLENWSLSLLMYRLVLKGLWPI